MPFINDVPVKSVKTHYELLDGSYETISENPDIRRFVWEHLMVVNQILQRLQNVSATVSAPFRTALTSLHVRNEPHYHISRGSRCVFSRQRRPVSMINVMMVCTFVQGHCSD